MRARLASPRLARVAARACLPRSRPARAAPLRTCKQALTRSATARRQGILWTHALSFLLAAYGMDESSQAQNISCRRLALITLALNSATFFAARLPYDLAYAELRAGDRHVEFPGALAAP